MQIQWFYRPETLAEHLFLSKSDPVYHQLVHVLRCEAWDPLICFDGQSAFCYHITQIDKKGLSADRKEPIASTHTPLPLRLMIALPHHKDKLELVIQKAVELGVSDIICVQTDFSGSPKYWNSKYYERLQNIIIEACEQSERIIIPTLSPTIIPLTDINIDKNTFACVERTDRWLSSVFPIHTEHTISIIIGPEGGWSPAERETLIASGQAFSLGDSVLRLETAALYALSVFRYELI